MYFFQIMQQKKYAWKCFSTAFEHNTHGWRHLRSYAKFAALDRNKIRYSI